MIVKIGTDMFDSRDIPIHIIPDGANEINKIMGCSIKGVIFQNDRDSAK